ncbi:hypothetical protein M422DRAFT_274386 [Sphaerobolus stellatus SS14]|uniref:Uncharacterized protein n=1 Tax=Sphaerobolus stellatus (strain SS14) TaxID=990650 RepID=A0A0C9T722_SPHS4|nr:hypothetical protein M422DRAFT_274386 [Sphaerobolus stellatus SS14]
MAEVYITESLGKGMGNGSAVQGAVRQDKMAVSTVKAGNEVRGTETSHACQRPKRQLALRAHSQVTSRYARDSDSMALWLLQNVSTAPVTCSRDKGALILGLTVQDTILSLSHGARGARRERNLITIEFWGGAELQIKNFLGWRLAPSITYLTSSHSQHQTTWIRFHQGALYKYSVTFGSEAAFHQLGNTWTNKDVVASLSLDGVLNVFDSRNGDGPVAFCMLSALPTPHPRILTSSLIQGPQKPITAATLVSSLPTFFTGPGDGRIHSLSVADDSCRH